MSLSQYSTLLHEQERLQERERVPARGKPVICNIITEVTPHHFYWILLIRSQKLGPAHSPGEGSTQREHTRRWGGLKAGQKLPTASTMPIFSCHIWLRGLEWIVTWISHIFAILNTGFGSTALGHWMWSPLCIKLAAKCWAELTWAPGDQGNGFSGRAEGTAPVWSHGNRMKTSSPCSLIRIL